MSRDADEVKFAELLLYVAGQLRDDPSGGATKVNKVLFFADFAHMRQHDRPITGVEYQKLPHGPAPRRLVPIRERLVRDGALEVRNEECGGWGLNRLHPLRPARLDLFALSELQAVDQAVEQLRRLNATETSERSHEEVGWQIVDEGETIPYETAYLRTPVLTDRIRSHAATIAAELDL